MIRTAEAAATAVSHRLAGTRLRCHRPREISTCHETANLPYREINPVPSYYLLFFFLSRRFAPRSGRVWMTALASSSSHKFFIPTPFFFRADISTDCPFQCCACRNNQLGPDRRSVELVCDTFPEAMDDGRSGLDRAVSRGLAAAVACGNLCVRAAE
jgi:hypothetical protein